MPLIESFKGGHTLTFDEDQHVYALDGKIVPGATEVKKGYPISFLLEQWKIGEGAKFVLEFFRDWRTNEDDFPSEAKCKELIKLAKSATKRILEETADIGTLMHDYAFSKRLAKPFDWSRVEGHKDEEQIRKRLVEVDWWVEERFKEEEVVEAETIIASVEHRFAGKFDCLVRRNGKLRLQDYKSSKNFYPDQFIQLGGYAIALEEWMGLKVQEFEVIRFNDNTSEPATLAFDKEVDLEDFKTQFLRCRYTREFQNKWGRHFDRLYRASRRKK